MRGPAYNLGLPGQYQDEETGFNYNYFRDYDPTTGRYIESDPIGLAGGTNTYTYVRNNPISGIDPLGLVDLNLFYPGSDYYNAANNISSAPGEMTIAAHGDSNNIYDNRNNPDPYEGIPEDAHAVADWLLHHGFHKGMKIRVYACNTGKSDGTKWPNFAQQLANILGTQVYAPSTFGWFFNNGYEIYDAIDPLQPFTSGENTSAPGHWNTFSPNGGFVPPSVTGGIH